MARTVQIKGHDFIVDDADYALVTGIAWSVISVRGYTYAQRCVCKDGLQWTQSLHREIMGAQPNQVVVFRDRNPLNCTRSNLLVTNRNGKACLRRTPMPTGFRGVRQPDRYGWPASTPSMASGASWVALKRPSRPGVPTTVQLVSCMVISRL